MSDPRSTPETIDVLDRFLEDLDQAADKEEVIRRYQRTDPDRADEFEQIARLHVLVGSTAAPAPPPVTLDLPDLRIRRRLGGGGMGDVYLAEQLSLRRLVAVKIRKERLPPKEEARFRREQEVLAHLHQTHIVPIHAAGQVGALQYFVMDYIAGAALHHVVESAWQHDTVQHGGKTPTLKELALETVSRGNGHPTGSQGPSLVPPAPGAASAGPANGALAESKPAVPSAATRPLPPGKLCLGQDYFRSVAQFLADAAEALHHAHEKGILHRDLKPSNMMVDTKGQCRLIDFGLAGYLAAGEDSGSAPETPAGEANPGLTDALIGTEGYMAPEQYQRQADRRTDVWGLGVTLYELLTLRRAFSGPNREAIRKIVLADEPVPPRALVRKVPADLVAICRKALRKDPAQRYQTTEAFAADLRHWLNGEPTSVRRHPLRRVALWARRNKGWAAALLVAGFSALAVAAALLANANERAQAAQRDLKVQNLQQLRLTTHDNGWSDDAWETVRALSKMGSSVETLRNQAAATLIGLDAQVVKRFPFTASALAFDRAGRLLMGGWEKEGARLWDEATGQVQTSDQGGPGPVAFRDDGTPLQVVPLKDDPAALVLWDLTARRQVRTFKVPGEGRWTVVAAVLTPNGALLAVSASAAEDKGTVVVWETATGKVVRQVPHPPGQVSLAPNGSLLAAGDAEGRITVWPLPQGEAVAVLPPSHNRIQSLAFGLDAWRDGRQPAADNWLLAAGDAGGAIVIWDLKRRNVRSYCRGSLYDVYALAFSPDRVTLASAGRGDVRLWDVATGQLLLRLTSGNIMTALAFSLDGKRLGVSFQSAHGYPAGVDVWEFREGRGLQTLRGLLAPVSKVWFSRDGRLLAALSHDWRLGIWDLKAGRLRHVIETPKGFYADSASLTFDPDSRRFAFASGTQAKLWDAESGAELRSWDNLPPGLVDVMGFCGSDKLLLFRVETQDNKPPNLPARDHPRVCRIRDLLRREPLAPIKEITEFNRHVFDAVGTSDGTCFVIDGIHEGPDGRRRTVRAFDGVSGAERWFIPSQRTVASAELALDPGGRLLSALLDNNPAATTSIDLSSGRTLATLGHYTTALGPGGLYSALQNGSPPYGFHLYRPEDKMPLVTLGLDTLATQNLSHFDPTGRLLAWGDASGSITVCDIPAVQHKLASLGLGW